MRNVRKTSFGQKVFNVAFYPAQQCLEHIRYEPDKGILWGVVAIVTAPITVPVMMIAASVIKD